MKIKRVIYLLQTNIRFNGITIRVRVIRYSISFSVAKITGLESMKKIISYFKYLEKLKIRVLRNQEPYNSVQIKKIKMCIHIKLIVLSFHGPLDV